MRFKSGKALLPLPGMILAGALTAAPQTSRPSTRIWP